MISSPIFASAGSPHTEQYSPSHDAERNGVLSASELFEEFEELPGLSVEGSGRS
jgi:hypothetical protein